MPKREYDRIDRFATYRVKVTPYGRDGSRGRTRTLLIPATSNDDAENKARKRIPASGGYHFQTKKVADYWRESKD